MKFGGEEWPTDKVIDEIKKQRKEYYPNSKCNISVEELEAGMEWFTYHECNCDNKKDNYEILLVSDMRIDWYKAYVKCCYCGAIFDPSQNRVILSGRSNEDWIY